MRGRRLRRLALAAAATAVVLAALAFAVAGQGGLDLHPAPFEVGEDRSVAGAPGWSRPCWAGRLESDGRHARSCARLRGRVIWVTRDAGDGDAHLVTVAGRRLRYAKISRQVQSYVKVPGVGDAVTVVGPMVGGDRVREQVNVWALEPGF
ncbi:MAG TPA: hypothetical protein VNT32_11290 [Thermoleophilaceae bacterium]|nr:hypothetical protein [Thermoleophilaceae bacterium]